MASAAQIAANRANAARSTGPRTAEGKAQSRANALVHGLAGSGVVLPEAMARDVDARLEAWSETLRPADDVEGFLVRAAVAESVKYDHATRRRSAALALRVRHAGPDWESGRRHQVEAIVAALDTSPDPEALISRLLDTAEGCSWMIAEWSDLDASYEATGRWKTPRLARALTLLGERRTPDDPGPRTLAVLKLHAAMAPDPRMEAILDKDDLAPEVAAQVDAYAARIEDAGAALRRFIASEVAALAARRDRLSSEVDGPDLAEAAERALFDPEDDLPLRRYETACLREVSRALDSLAKLRKEAGRAAPRGGGEESKAPKPVVNTRVYQKPSNPPPPACPRGESPGDGPLPARNEPNPAANPGSIPVSDPATPAVAAGPGAVARPATLPGPAA